MSTKVVNTAPLGEKVFIKSAEGQVAMTKPWDAHFRDGSATLKFDPVFELLGVTTTATYVGVGFKTFTTIDLNVNITGTTTSVQGTTLMVLPFKAFQDGFLNVFDSTFGVKLFLGVGFIPANDNKCYLPSWVSKPNISLIGSYRAQAGS
jgi:hypothetical protein